MKLCMNPGNIHDWSILDGEMTVAASNFGPFDNIDESEDSFNAIVQLAKEDAIPFEYHHGLVYSYDSPDCDLYFITPYDSVDALRTAFDKVIAFLKEQ